MDTEAEEMEDGDDEDEDEELFRILAVSQLRHLQNVKQTSNKLKTYFETIHSRTVLFNKNTRWMCEPSQNVLFVSLPFSELPLDSISSRKADGIGHTEKHQ